MKKILFLWSTSFWDRIASIPYLLKMKEEWNKVYLLEYWEWYINYLHKQSDIYSLYKDNNLYEDLFIIPHNKFKLILFILKNFHKFDLAYAPTWTLVNNIRWLLFWKKWKYTFKSLNDNTKYDNFVSWMLESKETDFFKFSKKIKIFHSKNYHELVWWNQKFVTIFVWPYSWSIEAEEWNNIIKYIESSWLKIILLWSKSNDREWWILPYLNGWNIINLLWKTNFEDLCSIISDAEYTISANWWIMWLSHLLNEKSISFSTTSWAMIHPPVDNKKSFHIKSSCNIPCELKLSEMNFKKKYHQKCKFGLICKMLRWEKIINIIEKFY